MTKVLAIDIETMPNEDMVAKLPEVVADARLKDPEKIQADIDRKKKEQISKMALSPLYGKIACVGYYGDELREVKFGNEADLIREFLERSSTNIVVTWNGKGFDYDFVIKRGVILGVCPLCLLDKYTERFKQLTHIDLMEKWCGYGKYLSLDEISSVLLDSSKGVFDVDKIKDLVKTADGRKQIADYCLNDCRLTYELAQKMGYGKELIY